MRRPRIIYIVAHGPDTATITERHGPWDTHEPTIKDGHCSCGRRRCAHRRALAQLVTTPAPTLFELARSNTV